MDHTPPSNAKLVELLIQFRADPTPACGQQVMDELHNGDAVLFVGATRPEPLHGEPPLEKEDLILMAMPEGVETRMIKATTVLDREEAKKNFLGKNFHFCEMRSDRFMRLIRELGVILLILDPGHPTETFMGIKIDETVMRPFDHASFNGLSSTKKQQARIAVPEQRSSWLRKLRGRR